MKILRTRDGFTIVELLIVIVIIGILASITAVAYNGIQDRARATKTSQELAQLLKAIEIARINQGTTLMKITGSNCTSCSDTDGAKMASALDKIGAAAGMNLSGLKAGDGWGDPYKLDENEGESVTTPCKEDTFSLNSSTKKITAGVTIPSIPTYSC